MKGFRVEGIGRLSAFPRARVDNVKMLHHVRSSGMCIDVPTIIWDIDFVSVGT